MPRLAALTTPELRGLLGKLYDLGRLTHVGVALAEDVFRSGVASRIAQRLSHVPSATRNTVAEVLEQTSGADLYLVLACDDGVAGAWKHFVTSYETRLRKLAIHLGAQDVHATCHDLLGDLAAPTDRSWARTRLGTYLGAGTLFAWLGVALRRRLVDSARTARRHPRTGVIDLPEQRDATDPLASAMASELSSRLEALLRAAWEDLDDRARLIILCKYREGLTQRTIASLLGLSEARVSRLLGETLGRIRRRVLRELRDEDAHPWHGDTRLWHELMAVVAKQLATSPPAGDAKQEGRLA